MHVVFGAGQVGTPLAQTLVEQGQRVRVIRRSHGEIAAGAELVPGDARDPGFCARACEGASVIYHCMNPASYDSAAWAKAVPRLMDNLITAAGGANARLVVLDNLYMLGRTGGRPMNPCSRKGEIRARAAERLLDAHKKGAVRAVSGRASDYYGPRGTLTFLGDAYWRPALAGKTVRSPVDPGALHTYHYIPDVVAGLARLGSAPEDALGRAWMLPCQRAGSLADLSERFAHALGRRIHLGRIPKLVLKAAGLLVPLVRELNEMLYQWDEPFIVDDRRFRERFAAHPVGADVAARETVAWAKRHYVRA